VQKKKNTIQLVPLTQDIVQLGAFIKSIMNKSLDAVNISESPLAFLLAHIILFNRRRAGDVRKFKLAVYMKNTDGSNTVAEEDFNLSAAEKALAQSLTRIEVESKKRRPMLLSKNMHLARRQS
jgi:hypothetical protein